MQTTLHNNTRSENRTGTVWAPTQGQDDRIGRCPVKGCSIEFSGLGGSRLLLLPSVNTIARNPNAIVLS